MMAVSCMGILAVWAAVPAAHPDGILRRRLENQIRECKAEFVAVAFHDLESGEELLIDADRSFHPASVMKLPVMMEIYRQASEGGRSIDARLPVKNSFVSIADGSEFSLSPNDDSERSLYGRIGRTESIRTLVRLMITESSNLAANILIEQARPERVTAFMENLGAAGVVVRRGVEDNRAFALGRNNAMTARGTMTLLLALAEGPAVSPAASAEMVEVMRGQKHRRGIPAGLPRGTAVANKTGWTGALNHDAAIVMPKGRRPYVLVVFTQGIAEQKAASRRISEISKIVFDETAGKWPPNKR